MYETSLHGYKVAFRSLLQRINKSPDEKLEDTGVYNLPCTTCPKYYIGQTGRNFKT